MTDKTPPRQLTVIYADPDTLLTDRNIRDVHVDDDMVATVKDVGILMPVLAVHTPDDQLRVRIGHRRVKAAALAGVQVPVIDIGPEGSSKTAQVTRIIEQWTENTQRAGLTTAETIGVVAALFEFGQSAATIHRRTRIPAEDIARAQAIARSELATRAAQRWEFLDLAQSADLAEYEHDPEAVKALVAAAKEGRGRYDHVRQEIIDTAAERTQRAALLAALATAGIPVVDGAPYGSQAGYYCDASGARFDDQSHRACPGNAVFLRKSWADSAAMLAHAAATALAYAAGEPAPEEPDEGPGEDADDDGGMPAPADEAAGGHVWVPVVVCTDPDGNGHKAYSYSYGSRQTARKKAADMEPAEREAARVARAELMENNRQWRTARKVRRDWIKASLAGAGKPRPGGVRWVMDVLAAGPSELRIAMEKGHPLAAEMLGLDPEQAGRWGKAGEFMRNVTAGQSDQRASAIGVLIVVCAIEGWINDNAWQAAGTPWRTWPSATGPFLRVLEGWGYTLSRIEEEVAAASDAQPEPAGPAAEPVPVRPEPSQMDTGHGIPAPPGEDMCQVPEGCPNGPGPHVFDPDGDTGAGAPPCAAQPAVDDDAEVPAGYAGDDPESSRR